MQFIYLLIELLDELVFGVGEAAWPLIRTDLGLTYAQIGLALSLPKLIAALIEPFVGILGDIWRRRTLILGGGIFFSLALLLIGQADAFPVLLFGWALINPSSGAFVSLSQASLMDSAPDRHDQNMARWAFAGSLGVVAGPLLLGGIVFLGGTWRLVFISLGLLAVLTLLGARQILPRDARLPWPGFDQLWCGLKDAFSALRRGEVVRWLVLLEFSDFMLDILYGYLALYFVDVVGLTPANAAFAIGIWTVVGLLGDFLLIPLLEHVDGLAYLRVSVLAELFIFPAFLLISNLYLKLIFLGLMGLFNAGWYAILKGRLYSSMPGRSGSVMALNQVGGLLGSFLPFFIGLAAQHFGLANAMWLLLAGPLALLLGLPRKHPEPGT
ncbi:MAG: hypothetical protein Kow002_08670 [Anaerolineales bacterium]